MRPDGHVTACFIIEGRFVSMCVAQHECGYTCARLHMHTSLNT